MNKMAKGALAIGVGAALLLGGGGTLATWNATASVAPGTIAAGDLNIVADKTKSTWTNAAGSRIADISTYRVVPGDVLTFTQQLDLTLVGDQMKAELKFATEEVSNTFTSSQQPDVTMSAVDAAGKPLTLDPANLTPESLAGSNGVVTAKAVFTFNPDTSGRTDTNVKVDLGKTKFTLTQVVKK